MSRSLGDKVAHSVGVSSHPEVLEFTISLDDKFIVIASDGLWEFMSNEEVSRIVGPFYDQNQPEQASNALVKAAHARWLEVSFYFPLIFVIGRGSNRRHHRSNNLFRTQNGLFTKLLIRKL